MGLIARSSGEISKSLCRFCSSKKFTGDFSGSSWLPMVHGRTEPQLVRAIANIRTNGRTALLHCD